MVSLRADNRRRVDPAAAGAGLALAAVAVAVALALVATPGGAHVRSASSSSWTIDNNGMIDATVRLALRDLARLGEEKGWPAHEAAPVAAYLTAAFAIGSAATPCPIARPVEQLADGRDGWAGYRLSFDCSHSRVPLVLRSDLLLDVMPSHVHFATFRAADGGRAVEKVLTDGDRTWRWPIAGEDERPAVRESVRRALLETLAAPSLILFVALIVSSPSGRADEAGSRGRALWLAAAFAMGGMLKSGLVLGLAARPGAGPALGSVALLCATAATGAARDAGSRGGYAIACAALGAVAAAGALARGDAGVVVALLGAALAGAGWILAGVELPALWVFGLAAGSTATAAGTEGGAAWAAACGGSLGILALAALAGLAAANVERRTERQRHACRRALATAGAAYGGLLLARSALGAG
ncbi:MAG: hypothetical protein HYV63_12240 [Candidatus Schekmanbacteria bacterium]|nr:hypothetical protein [Candidatus Schekmanbacteria bacterium]